MIDMFSKERAFLNRIFFFGQLWPMFCGVTLISYLAAKPPDNLIIYFMNFVFAILLFFWSANMMYNRLYEKGGIR